MMKLRSLFIFLAVLNIALMSCQSSENNTETTEIISPVVEQASITSIEWLDSALDKGTITEGEKIEIIYRFKNTGEKPLIIKDVRPSCGCTVAEKPIEPIAPGKEGSIKALFDSQNRPGPTHKTITVISNTDPESYALTFNVMVNKKS